MKIYESSALRPFGSLVRGVLTMSMVGGVLWAFSVLFLYGASGRWRPQMPVEALTSPLFLGAVGVALLIGIPVLWTSVGESRGTYRMAPTELEIWSGFLNKKMVAVKYRDISGVGLSQGPLMQLLGTFDLTISAPAACAFSLTTLRGIRNGPELRLRLLERRDSLQALESDES